MTPKVYTSFFSFFLRYFLLLALICWRVCTPLHCDYSKEKTTSVIFPNTFSSLNIQDDRQIVGPTAQMKKRNEILITATGQKFFVATVQKEVLVTPSFRKQFVPYSGRYVDPPKLRYQIG